MPTLPLVRRHRLRHVLANAAVAGKAPGRAEHRFSAYHQILLRAIGLGAAVDEIQEGFSGGQVGLQCDIKTSGAMRCAYCILRGLTKV